LEEHNKMVEMVRKENKIFRLNTYVGRFLPDLADTTEPLRKLLEADEKFLWNQIEPQAFDKLKIGVSRVPELFILILILF